MTTKRTFLRHKFAGGWDTDSGPTVDVVPEGHIVQVPFLVEADNIVYEFDGGPRKAPGTTKLNSVVLESGADVKGVYDYWITGTAASPAQHRICHVGTTIKKDDADGTFANLFTGLEADKVPDYTVFEDKLIIASDSTTDVPKSWDGTTAQNLAGTPPNFAFSAVHRNRIWAAGDAANPSRLYYAVSLNPEDWISGGSGTIDIDPSDGDRITGIISHKSELWVFKGPYKGSIHRISGAAPTGSDPFSLAPFIKGLGCVAHNTIFRFGDDIGFMWSDGTVHSLAATAAFGDFNEAALSRPIHTYLREHLNFARLTHAHAVNWTDLGIVLFSVPIDAATQPNMILTMDYRFNGGVRWSRWSSFSNTALSLASVVDASANNRRIIIGGGTDGFIRKYGQSTRSIDGNSSISYKVTIPQLTYGDAVQMKVVSGGAIGFQPKNTGNVTFGWTRDGNAQQTRTVSQDAGGAALGVFVLGTDTLGGSRFVDKFFELEEGGEFRSLGMEVTNNVNNEDVEIHSISNILEPGSWSMENN
ncbi:MAG: hypothetical protein ABUK15_07330 [Anaerolineales bacterium]